MSKMRRTVVLVLVLFLFGVGIFSGVKVSNWFSRSTGPRTYNTPALLVQVQTLSQLVTVKYVIEKVEVLEVPSENVLGMMAGSKNQILLLAHGVVKGGIDLKRLKQEDLRIEGNKIVVRLPQPQILDCYLDENKTRVIDRQTGLLAPPDKDLEQQARQNAVDGIRRSARSNGILRDAEERARAQVTNLLLQLGFEKVEFQTSAAVQPSGQ